MKKLLAITMVCIVILTSFLTGCEQFFMKPEQVNINVMIAVSMNAVDENFNPINISFMGVEVNIQIFKNGNILTGFKRFMQKNLCQASYNLDLIKGDSIECIVTVPNGYENFHPIVNGSAILTWETAHANLNFAGLYNWYPHITIIMKQNLDL